jgi:ferredoxin
VTVTPAECVQCRLCEDACPFGAIRHPTPERAPESRRTGLRRTALAVAATPLLIALGIWLGSHLGVPLSYFHENTRVADALAREDAGLAQATVDTTAFRATGRSTEDLQAEVQARRDRLDAGGAWLGAFIGLVIGVKLISRSIYVRRKDYTADRGACLACGRCYRFCPVKTPADHARKGQEPDNAADS